MNTSQNLDDEEVTEYSIPDAYANNVPVNGRRLRAFYVPCSSAWVMNEIARVCPSRCLRFLQMPKQYSPRSGDIVVTQVIDIAHHKHLTDLRGSMLPLFPGMVVVGTMAARYAPDEFAGEIPHKLQFGDTLHILNHGGSVGHVTFANTQISNGPSKLKFLAYLSLDYDLMQQLNDAAASLMTPLKSKSDEDYPCVPLNSTMWATHYDHGGITFNRRKNSFELQVDPKENTSKNEDTYSLPEMYPSVVWDILQMTGIDDSDWNTIERNIRSSLRDSGIKNDKYIDWYMDLLKKPLTVQRFSQLCNSTEIPNPRDTIESDKGDTITSSLKLPKIIVHVGAQMNSGKTNSAKACIYGLTAAGQVVVAGKVTGTSAKKDVLLMKAAGALMVKDFIDFGYPSTANISEDDLITLLSNHIDVLIRQYAVNNLITEMLEQESEGTPDSPILTQTASGFQPFASIDYVVLEFADGILNPENQILLNSTFVKDMVTHWVFSAGDALALVAGVSTLYDLYSIQVSCFSGPVANGPLCVRELVQYIRMSENSLMSKLKTTDGQNKEAKEASLTRLQLLREIASVPYFNNMKLDIQHISNIFLEDGPRSKKVLANSDNKEVNPDWMET